MNRKETYSLRQVADLTGLSEFTLRGWEGRYRAFSPGRTETGRRLYRKEDLKKALLLRELTHHGHRISELASLNLRQLESLLKSETLHASSLQLENFDSLFQSIFSQDWNLFEKELSEKLQRKNAFDCVEKVFLPLLGKMGHLVLLQKVSIAQEHIVSSLIKEHVYRLLIKSTPQKTLNHCTFILATPEGDFHEIGLLLAHLILKAAGLKTLFLGPNTPKNDLCQTTIRFGATHVVLATTVDARLGAKEEIYSYLHYLDQHLPEDIKLWIGGKNSEGLFLKLNRKVEILRSLKELLFLIEKETSHSKGKK